MAATKTDYYDVLGVARDADGESIRKAFHARARERHPDASAAPDAQRRFQELAEAYGVLSKPGARLLYDRYGYLGRGNSGFEEERWDGRERAVRGASARAQVEIRAVDAELGARRVVRFETLRACRACEGRGATRLPDPACAACGGTGRCRQVSQLETARMLRIEVCPECASEPCPDCSGAGRALIERTLRLRIPAGVENGAQLRVAGEGEQVDGGIPGDLLVDVRVLPAPRDPRLVRSLALAGCLAALAILLYLVL